MFTADLDEAVVALVDIVRANHPGAVYQRVSGASAEVEIPAMTSDTRLYGTHISDLAVPPLIGSPPSVGVLSDLAGALADYEPRAVHGLLSPPLGTQAARWVTMATTPTGMFMRLIYVFGKAMANLHVDEKLNTLCTASKRKIIGVTNGELVGLAQEGLKIELDWQGSGLTTPQKARVPRELVWATEAIKNPDANLAARLLLHRAACSPYLMDGVKRLMTRRGAEIRPSLTGLEGACKSEHGPYQWLQLTLVPQYMNMSQFCRAFDRYRSNRVAVSADEVKSKLQQLLII